MNSPVWIETARTRMRAFDESDEKTTFPWFSDEDVMRFIPGGRDATPDDTRGRIARYRRHQDEHGFSKRLIIHGESGIGDAGLYYLPDGERIELGFRLAKAYWGQGYAVEIGRAWLKWFDENLSGRRL